MNEALTISKKKPTLKSQQYDTLREEGLKHLEEMSGHLWTDYNVHDPGITILEVLCYAITDLGYRTGFAVEDLLAVEGNNFTAMHEQFLTAIHVLPTRPVSETDFRKLICDIPGINNAWLVRQEDFLIVDLKDEKIVVAVTEGHHSKNIRLNGICNISIEPNYTFFTLNENKKKQRVEELTARVKSVFHRHRNLGEDLNEVSLIAEHEIIVCADLEIKPDADARTVYADALYEIEQHLSPAIRHYTLSEMLVKKDKDGVVYSTDRIFEGPRLVNGFIDTNELLQSQLRRTIYTSDLVNLLMDIPGVLSVKKIALNYCEEDQLERSNEWSIAIRPGHKPTLCREKSIIRFFKDVIPVPSKLSDAEPLLQQKYERIISQRKDVATADLSFPVGKFRGLSEYTSLTHDFPQTYGIGKAGLPVQATPERQGKANQLKAYLLFFDQVLANYLSQLSRVRSIFSSDPEIRQTYFSQPVTDVASGESLFSHPENLAEKLDALSETPSVFLDRRNRFLDHLLARFNESFSEYALQLFTLEGEAAKKESVNAKAHMLQRYRETGYHRSGGFDYFNSDQNFWDSDNVSGLEKRLAMVLGWSDHRRRNLKKEEVGLHVIEHILLRPEKEWMEKPSSSVTDLLMPVCVEEDCSEGCGLDPYSFRITVVIPARARHFDEVHYRRFLEKVIRLETPAHILPKICWVEQEELAAFEAAYKNWLELKTTQKISSAAGKKSVSALIKILFNLRSSHPDGELSSSNQEERQPDQPAVLSRTQLSNPKKK